jgi:hypothetical protein
MKTILIILGIIIGISILGFLLKVVMLPFFTAGKIVDTTYDITNKTLDADNVIYNYEWFKQRYEDLEAIENKIIIAQEQVNQFKDDAGERNTWTFEDKNEYARLNSIHQGLMNHAEDLIAEYNARSKMANRNIFKDGLIPSTLELGSNILTNINF